VSLVPERLRNGVKREIEKRLKEEKEIYFTLEFTSCARV